MLGLLVDGLNLVRRVYAAVPGDEGSPAHGEDVRSSCRRSLGRALDECAPTHALAAFDDPAPGWRHARFEGYKANRRPMPAPLAALLPDIEADFEGLGVRCKRVPGFEADDVLATIAVGIAARGGRCVILSTDKSMLSLLREGVAVRNHFEHRDLTAEDVRERFGVAPGELALYLALVGDASQNVPGVRGVGPKTAARLIAAHGDLAGILHAAESMDNRVGRNLREERAQAALALELATLREDVAVGLNLNECRLAPPAEVPG